MRALLLAFSLVAIASACLPPLKPLPPIGCSYDNAVLITQDNSNCYWVYMNCN